MKHLIWFWLLFFCRFIFAQSAQPVVLSQELANLQMPYKMKGHEIRIFEDITDKKTISDMVQLPDSCFRPLRHNCCNFGTEKHRLWLKFKVSNQTKSDAILIELVNPFITKVILFQSDTLNKLLITDTTGTAFPFDQRPVMHRNFIFPLPLKQHETSWIYLSFEPDYPLDLSILIWEKSSRFGIQQRLEDILLTIFFTFCILFLVLSTLLILQSKQYYIWPYYIYVVLTTAFIPSYLGLGYRYVWPVAPYLQFVVPATLNCLRLVFGILFFQKFFDIPNRSKLFHRFLQITISVFLFTALMVILHKWTSLVVMRIVLNFFFATLILFSTVMMSWTLYQILFKKKRNIIWTLLIIGIHVFVQATTALQFLGYGSFDPMAAILPFGERLNTFFVQTSLLAGFFVEILAVFYFVAQRYFKLIEAQQKVHTRLTELREEGINNLIIGIENERKRIASDLHDGACVNIAAVKMNIETYQEKLPDGEYKKRLAEIVEDLDNTYREVRDISHSLMSKALEKTDLLTALEDYIDRIRATKPDLEIQFYANIDPTEIAYMAKVQIYRIIQELLTNIIKHANAKSANIQILRLEDKVILTIEDDGVGYDKTKINGNGIGLSNIQLRVSMLQGQLRVETALERGTFVSIELSKDVIHSKHPVS